MRHVTGSWVNNVKWKCAVRGGYAPTVQRPVSVGETNGTGTQTVPSTAGRYVQRGIAGLCVKSSKRSAV